jgi:23S rRNA (uracil1939-C5)-methyltransferase
LLARKVARAVGVELVSPAVTAARENATLNGLTNCEFIEGDVTAYLKALVGGHETFDTIVIDPPRAGLHPKALKRIIEYRPAKLLYISCNPATFARDAKDLINTGYRLSTVIPVDMFPHTMHIEVVGLYTR